MTAKIYQFPARDGRARFKDIEQAAPYAALFRTAHEITFTGSYKADSHDIHIDAGSCIAHMKDGSIIVTDKDSLLKTLEAMSARAVGRKIGCNFTDAQICLALRVSADSYAVMQYPLETPNLKKAVPQMSMKFNAQSFEKIFSVQAQGPLDAGLFDAFNKYAGVETAKPGQNVYTCTQTIRNVYVIENEGEWKDSRQHFNRGDIVIEYAQGGLIVGGPAEEMKKRLLPGPISPRA